MDLQLVTDENHDHFLQSSAAVVVFSLVPCQQCEEYEPIVIEAAGQLETSVRFGKAKMHVPVVCKEIKRRYQFKSYPTTHFYKNGELLHKTEGRLDLSTLKQTIDEVLLT